MIGTMRLRKGLSWRRVGDDIVVLDLDQSCYVSISGAGAVVWEHLAKGASLDDVLDRIVDEYDVDREQAAADVEAFVQNLRDRRLMA